MGNDLYLISYSKMKKLICLYVKICISIRTKSCSFPVEIHFCIAVDSLKFKDESESLIFLRYKKFFLIHIVKSFKPADVNASQALLRPLFIQHCIMRDRNRFSLS